MTRLCFAPENIVPTLETQRLRLRPLDMSDAPQMQTLASDYTIAAMTLSTPHPYPEDAAQAFIASTKEQLETGVAYVFAIVPHTASALVGVVGIHPQPAHQRAELGYWMGSLYRGSGYMTEAVKRVMRFGFEDLRLNRIYAACYAENIASKRVMQKAGMVYEGRLRQHFIRFDTVHDAVYYGALRAEWQERP